MPADESARRAGGFAGWAARLVARKRRRTGGGTVEPVSRPQPQALADAALLDSFSACRAKERHSSGRLNGSGNPAPLKDVRSGALVLHSRMCG